MRNASFDWTSTRCNIFVCKLVGAVDELVNSILNGRPNVQVVRIYEIKFIHDLIIITNTG